MPWKMDGDKIALDNGNPVWVFADGKESVFEGDHITQKLSDLSKENEKWRKQARDAQTKVESFGEIDIEQAKKALNIVSNLDAKKLIDAGEAEKVRAEAVRAEQERVRALSEENQSLKDGIYSEKLENSFAQSELVQKKLAIPSRFAKDSFGKAFKLEDGKMVAYDESGNKIYSREKPGELAGFDEALSMLIDRHPDKARILLDSGKSGGGAGPGGAGGGGAKTITRGQYKQMTPAEQSAHIKGGGTVTD